MKNKNLQLAKEWIIKSQNDLKTAEILLKENGPTDTLCFHCHQVAEKALKGFLVFHQREVPKIHDLVMLLNLCKTIDKKIDRFKRGLASLNKYYIESRYPPEIIVYSKKDCEKAFKDATNIFQYLINIIFKKEKLY